MCFSLRILIATKLTFKQSAKIQAPKMLRASLVTAGRSSGSRDCLDPPPPPPPPRLLQLKTSPPSVTEPGGPGSVRFLHLALCRVSGDV